MDKKILFVSYALNNGGAERVLSILANQLVAQGQKASVLLYRRTENEYPLAAGVKLLELGAEASHGSNGAVRSWNRVKAIRRVILEEKPDYVIPFLDSMVRESFLAAMGTGIPVIATVRNSPFHTPETEAGRRVRNLICRLCAGVFVQNSAQKAYFAPDIQKKTFVLPNPVPDSLLYCESPCVTGIEKFITCGRLHEQKNHKMLVDAFAEVVKMHPGCTLSVYGVGPLQQELESYIASRHMEDHIFLRGRTENVLQALQAHDCFVLSSDFEGMPNALMEALAVGLPCISTDCPTGPADLIEQGKTGYLVPVGDCAALAEQMCDLVERPEEAIACALRAKEHMQKNYAQSVIAGRLLEELWKIRH